MLPCQKNCPHFFTGCHKTCPAWREFQAQQADLRRRIRQARTGQYRLYAIDNALYRRDHGRTWH